MISSTMQEAMNQQVNAELYSAYLYLAMAANFEEGNLHGMAHWMQIQAKEEAGHALKFFKHIVDRGGRVTLSAVAAPPAKWDSPHAVFDQVYKHERDVSGLIDKLVDLAAAEKDHASSAFLQWFVTEQVEEEANASDIQHQLKMIGESKQGLFMLDRHLAQRQ
ncbi:MAG: ferritin [Terriglobia bacterium]